MNPIPKLIKTVCTDLSKLYGCEVILVDGDVTLEPCKIGVTIERIIYHGGETNTISIGLEGTLHVARLKGQCNMGKLGGLIFGAYEYQEGRNTLPIEFGRVENVDIGRSSLTFRVTTQQLPYSNNVTSTISEIKKFNVNGEEIYE